MVGNIFLGKICCSVLVLFLYETGCALACECLTSLMFGKKESCPPNSEAKCPTDKVEFWLYTRTNQSDPIKLEMCSLDAAPWVIGPLKMIIHGYLNNKDSEVNEVLRHAYLANRSCNVVSMDWGTLAAPSYLLAVNNVYPAARCLSEFIRELTNHGIFCPQNIHILGHSLGAHIANVASCNATGVGRMTLLDPAHPLCDNFPRGEAGHIAVHHTNCGQFGQSKPSGHVDVYYSPCTYQPGHGCDTVRAHGMCFRYYAESVHCGTAIRAFPSDGWQTCNGKYVIPAPSEFKDVGEHMNTKLKGNYMAFPAAEPPYLSKDPYKMCGEKHDGVEDMIKECPLEVIPNGVCEANEWIDEAAELFGWC